MPCVICGTAITEANDSNEHLVLNAIGGRKILNGVLCADCNNRAGDKWDDVLAAQLNPLSLLFRIKRHRGDVPSQTFPTSGGERLTVHADGGLSPEKPTYVKTPLPGAGVQIQIIARSVKEARKMVEGVARKYPQLDVEVALQAAENISRYVEDPLKFSLSYGGPEGGRSVVKSTVCLAASLGVPATSCQNAHAYLTDTEAEACFGFYYDRDLVVNRPQGVPFHCVAVSNRGTDGQLLGYVEFFGVQRMVIRLADHYDGPDVHSSYCIDPILGQELQLNVDLALSRSDVRAIEAYECIPPGSVERAFDQVLPGAQQAAFDRERKRVVDQAVDHAWSNCGLAPGDSFTADDVPHFVELMMEKLQPFLMRNRIRVPPTPDDDDN
jgi:HNH endonuclease